MNTLLSIAAASMLSVAPNMADFEWHGPVAKGRVVEIRGVTGDIRAIPSSSEEVEVTARVARDGQPDRVDIQVNDNGNGVTICAVRGQGSCPSTVDPLAAPGARVDYIVKVPHGVHFNGHTVNGEITIDSLQSNVEASTVNGTVVISTTGTAQARTVNGSIKVALLKPFWSKAPDLSTVNGAITLHIPYHANTAVKAETRNGKIVTEMPFRGSATDQSLEGKIGHGSGGGAGNPLLLRSINGSIEIKGRY